MSLPFHPLANLFPLIEGAEFDVLVASIKANGLRDPITVHDGMVIDGRNRQRACDAADVDCVYHPLATDVDPLQFVLDKNLHRRHLNESQRAYVAAKLANLGEGRPAETAQICAVSQSGAADRLHVGRRSVQHAVVVLDKAEPEIQREVERGTLPVSAAAQAAKLAPEQQRQVAAEASAGRANVVRTVIKQQSRQVRERALGAKQIALPQQKFGVILADPEWHDEVWSHETGMNRHAANHYPTSAEDVIASRAVAPIAADDCVLWLWTTNQHLRIAMSVMEAWGFTYRSNYCWGKDRISLGRWHRGKHELLLIGTKGSPPCPAPGTQWESLLLAPKTKHSAKPDLFVDMIDMYFPTLPKIELNRRGPARKGWSAWGNEAIEDGAACSPHEAAPQEPAPLTPCGAGSLSPAAETRPDE